MPLPDWDAQYRGEDCPFCIPLAESDEWGVKVAELSVTVLQLGRDQTYRGSCALIFTARHVNGIEYLTEPEHAALAHDLRRVALAITAAVKPDHMNYATLGNSIPHLHWHIIPRYKTDSRWGSNPFWWGPTSVETVTKLASEQDYQDLAAEIRRGL